MIFLLTAIGVFLADFAFKRYAEKHYEEGGQPKEALGGRIIIRRVNNSGSAGGFFQDKSDLVKILSTAVLGIAAVRFLILLCRKGQAVLKFGYALLLGGGAGNLSDRWMHGYVTDFFSFKTKLKHFGSLVFNLADIFIALGSVIAFIASLFSSSKKKS